MGAKKTLLGLWVFAAVVTGMRLWIAAHLPLAPDEAYYWQWSLAPALRYPDHPPLIAWLIHGSTWLLGNTPLGVRLCMPLIAGAAIGITYRLSRLVGLTINSAALTAALATIIPAPAVSAIIATPDTPLGLLWLIMVHALVRLSRFPSPGAWLSLGAAMGLGLLTKHSGLLIPISVLVAVAIVPRLRQDLRQVHPWLGATVGLLIALPYLIAEFSAGFSAVLFQLDHLSGKLSPSGDAHLFFRVVRNITELLAGQIGLLTPLVAGWLIVAVVKHRKNTVHPAAVTGLVVPLLATILSALFTHPEQNWASLGHPLAAIIVVQTVISRFVPAPNRKRRLWLAAIMATVAFSTVVIHTHAMRPFLPLPADRDPISRLHGWHRLEQLGPYINAVDAVVCDNYGLAALVQWHLRSYPTRIPVCSGDRGPTPPKGRWLLLDQRGEWGDRPFSTDCVSQTRHDDIEIHRSFGGVYAVLSVSTATGCRETKKSLSINSK